MFVTPYFAVTKSFCYIAYDPSAFAGALSFVHRVASSVAQIPCMCGNSP